MAEAVVSNRSNPSWVSRENPTMRDS
jgi:hypothetical protein